MPSKYSAFANSGVREVDAHEKQRVRGLMAFRIVKEKLLYIIGVPRRYAEEKILKSAKFCGQFGVLERIVINHSPKDVYEDQVAVYVHYQNPISVAIALKVSDI